MKCPDRNRETHEDGSVSFFYSKKLKHYPSKGEKVVQTHFMGATGFPCRALLCSGVM